MGQIQDAYDDYQKNKLKYTFTSPTFSRSKRGPQLKSFVIKSRPVRIKKFKPNKPK